MKKHVVLLAIAVLLVAMIVVLGTDVTLEIYTDPQVHDPYVNWIGCSAYEATLIETHVEGSGVFSGGMKGDGTTYLTSWYPTEISETILVDRENVTMELLCEESNQGYWGVDVQGYWWEVEVDSNADGNYDLVIMDEFGVKENSQGLLARVDAGYAGLHAWDLDDIPHGMKEIINLYDHNIACDNDATWYRTRNPEPWHGTFGLAKPESLNFRLYGPYDGVMRATLWVKGYSWSDKCWGAGDDRCRGERWLMYEEATLLSSWGNIEVIPNPEPPGGTIFEEGQTMQLSISTEWAGTIPDGWVVKFYGPDGLVTEPPGVVKDNTGVLVYDDSVSGYTFGNEMSGHKISWDIPIGAYNPPGSGMGNEWGFKLYNTFTDVDSDFVHIIIQGGSELIPGPTTMTPDKPWDQYNVGDTVHLTVEAEANPAGTGIIDRFELRAWEDDDPLGGEVYHLWDIDPEYVYGDLFRGFIDIPITQTIYITIEARAWDGDPDDGGMPGIPDSMDVGFTPEGDPYRYTVKIQVIDDLTGANVEDATVILEGQVPQRTGYDGKVDFPFMANGTYSILVFKEGYMRENSEVKIDGESPNTIVIRLKQTLQILPLLICVLIVAIFGALAYLLPIWDVRIKVLIFIIGIVIALILYLIWTGIINFSLG